MKGSFAKLILLGFLAVPITTAKAWIPFVLDSGDQQISLLELYTSEGCSSCPPAEAWFSTLKNDPGLWEKLVPVSFHVDYWNHLGWPDPYSSEDYTQRQREYGAQWRSESIYTPEFVLNGMEAHPMEGNIGMISSDHLPGTLKATLQSDGSLRVAFLPRKPVTKTLIAEVALLGNDITGIVPRGENAGRNLHHDFIALALIRCTLEPAAASSMEEYKGTLILPSHLKVPATALALWVRSADSLTPIQAVGGWMKSA
jgi:hypothetical protein